MPDENAYEHANERAAFMPVYTTLMVGEEGDAPYFDFNPPRL